MKLNNNYISFKSDDNFNNKETKKAINNLGKEVKSTNKVLDGFNPSDNPLKQAIDNHNFDVLDLNKLDNVLKENTNDTLKPIKQAVSNLQEQGENLKNQIKELKNQQPKDKISEHVVKTLKWVSKTKAFNAVLKNSKGVGYLLVLGNTGKELVGTAIYTVQALTNEDLPPNKRKFIGMYDLGVGAISTSLSFVAGILTVAYQDKFIKGLLSKYDPELNAKYKKYAAAFGGIRYLIPLVSQNILIKRIIAPAIATPFAGKMKKKMEAKDALKSGQTPIDTKIPIENNIVLSSTKIKGTTPNVQDSAQRSENIFALYKHAIEDHAQ